MDESKVVQNTVASDEAHKPLKESFSVPIPEFPNKLPLKLSISTPAIEVYDTNGMDSLIRSRAASVSLNVEEADHIHIRFQDLEIGHELGRGGYGVVFYGKLHGSPVAIKRLHEFSPDKDDFFHEINVMRRLRHPNVVLFLGACIAPDPLCIVTELVSRGSLKDLIEDRLAVITIDDMKSYALDIAKGMTYLHHSSVIHLDLSPGNVLVTENNICKVGDFGVSKLLSGMTESVTNRGGGTVTYTAPEIYRGDRISMKCDVYSYALILWELFYRQKPYEDMNQHAICFNVVAYNLRPELVDSNYPPYGALIQECWAGEVSTRPDFDQIIEKLEVIDMHHPPRRENKIENTIELPEVVKKWTVDHVRTWAEQKYFDWFYDIIYKEKIDGEILLTIQKRDMTELGITTFGHRRQLEVEIETMKKEQEAKSEHVNSNSFKNPDDKDPLSDVDKWTIDNVITWAEQKKDFVWFEDLVCKHQLTGKILLTITKEDLSQDLGVTPFGHRRRIEIEIENLKKYQEQLTKRRSSEAPQRDTGLEFVKPVIHSTSENPLPVITNRPERSLSLHDSHRQPQNHPNPNQITNNNIYNPNPILNQTTNHNHSNHNNHSDVVIQENIVKTKLGTRKSVTSKNSHDFMSNNHVAPRKSQRNRLSWVVNNFISTTRRTQKSRLEDLAGQVMIGRKPGNTAYEKGDYENAYNCYRVVLQGLGNYAGNSLSKAAVTFHPELSPEELCRQYPMPINLPDDPEHSYSTFARMLSCKFEVALKTSSNPSMQIKDKARVLKHAIDYVLQLAGVQTQESDFDFADALEAPIEAATTQKQKKSPTCEEGQVQNVHSQFLASLDMIHKNNYNAHDK